MVYVCMYINTHSLDVHLCVCIYDYEFMHMCMYVGRHVYMCSRNEYIPFGVEFQCFGGKTLHYSIMMMSLCYVASDVISLS